MIRYLPPNGTAGLARSRVSGWSRVPCPPAITSASVLIGTNFPILSSWGLKDSLCDSKDEPGKYRLSATASKAFAESHLMGLRAPIVKKSRPATKSQEFLRTFASQHH